MKTISIAISESNKTDNEYYAECCRNWGTQFNTLIKIKQYKNNDKLLLDMGIQSVKKSFDILMIEADEQENDGIKIALKLRRMGYVGQIIFLARDNPGNRIEEVFDARGADYILKSSSHRFNSVFSWVVSAVRDFNMEYVLYNRIGEYRLIAISDIRYYDVQKNLVCVHYNNEYFEFLSTLAKVENQLCDRGFCRIHKMYIVSLDHVRRFSYKEVELSDGTTLSIGRAYQQKFKDSLERWRKSEQGETDEN